MSGFLEYRPQYDYKRELEAILRSYQLTEEELEELLAADEESPVEGRAEELRRLSQSMNYKPAVAVKERFDITPTDVLSMLIEGSEKVSELIKDIGLLPETKDVPSIEEYLKAKEENDAETTYEFEDFHENNLEVDADSTAKETLPVLIRQQEELDLVKDVLTKEFLPDLKNKKDDESLKLVIEKLREEETKDLETMIDEDRSGNASRLDYDKIAYENHLLKALFQRAEGAAGFAEEVREVAFDKQTIDGDLFEAIAGFVGKNPSTKGPLKTTNVIQFDTHLKNAEDARQRMDRLVDIRYKRKLYEEMRQVQTIKEEMKGLAQDIYRSEKRTEMDVVNIFLLDQLVSIEKVVKDSENLVDDLYRITELEELQEIDYLTSLSKKAECRIVHGILGGIVEKDWENYKGDLLDE